MVRNYMKTMSHTRDEKHFNPYKNYTEENLQQAIRAVQTKALNLDDAAKKYRVPRSTLALRSKKKGMFPTAGRPCLLSTDEEKILVDHLNLVASWGFPFDRTDLRLLVKSYFDKKGHNEPRLKNNLPGKDWATNFLKRNKDKVSDRFSSNISTKRAMVNRQNLDIFFNNARDVFTRVHPSLIINFDETNLTDNPGEKKFIFKRGSKYPERIVNSTKTAISIMYAGTAEGQLLPEYIVYKAEHMWNSWTQGRPEGARYNRSRSGWFDSACFEDWFYTIIVPYFRNKDGVKILVGDNLSSHFSPDVLKTCQEMNISFVCLPPNSTHIMQPLDVAFYAPLKKYWREILTDWKKSGGRKMSTLSKDVFPQLLKKLRGKLYENDKASENLISGFRKTGLFPFEPEEPKQRLPPEATADEHTPTIISTVVVDMLKEMRYGPESAGLQNQRRKKITVEPGKSVSAADVPSTSMTPRKITRKVNPPKGNIILPTALSNSSDSESSISFECNDGGNSPESFDSDDLPIFSKYVQSQLLSEKNEKASDSLEVSTDSEDIPLIELRKKINIPLNDSGEVRKPIENEWVLVEYKRKNVACHFVGKVISVSIDSIRPYTVGFLKKSTKTDRYLMPLKKDVDDISADNIKKILQPPKIDGTGKRMFFVFNEDLTSYKCE